VKVIGQHKPNILDSDPGNTKSSVNPIQVDSTMSSLHARRPPKLEQGDIRRKRRQQKQQNASHIKVPSSTINTNGGGSLRRPPNSAGIEVAMGAPPRTMGGGGNNGGGSTNSTSTKRFCSARRMILLILVSIFVTFLYLQMRGFMSSGASTSIVKSDGGGTAGLRGNQNVKSIDAKPDVNPG